MTEFKPFAFKNENDFLAALRETTPDIPYAADAAPCRETRALGGFTAPNRLAVHPMEGADGKEDGGPDELTFRRYRRFGAGGAGLLWFEATAVTPDGRANPRQLHIHKNNVGAFRELREESLRAAPRRPYTVLQLTHSGRQSRPGAEPAPVIAQPSPLLDRAPGRVVTDDELERLRDRFVDAAVLAADAGFDAVDIKACHGYLVGELLTARGRAGKYGGSFENRVRLMLEIVDAVRARLGGKIGLASRLGVWDSIPLPYGWGVDAEDYRIPDFSEPLRLVSLLREKGVALLDVTCGNPYFNPHVNRPFDRGFYTPPENQMLGAAKLLRAARAVQEAAPDVAVVGTGLSWYRQFGAGIAAGCLGEEWFAFAGFGRQAFAYPGFAGDIVEKGALAPEKCCIACGNCTVIMRDGGRSGCMARDGDPYLGIYRAGREGKPGIDMRGVAEHL